MKTNNRDERGGKRRQDGDNRTVVSEKKPFDKKKYRQQKYSNKYKVEQWEERRKKAVLRGFYKELHKDKKSTEKPTKKFLHPNKLESKPEDGSNPKKKSPFFAAKREFQKKRSEKEEKKAQIMQSKAEREEAMKKYKENKFEKNKKFFKKTKKGQPVMKDRLELLLEKIQESTSAN